MENKTPIICLKSEAFYALLNSCIEHIDTKFNLSKQDKWVDTAEALKLLHIDSRTTLATIRDAGKLRFSSTTNKNVLYDRDSILTYIENNAKATF